VSKPAEILAADLAQSSATQPGCAGLTTERILAGVLADVMHAERVPADSNFFDDLGADSMLMAQFCARVRKRGDLPPVSMKDIYQHPTISTLATALTDATATPVERILAGVLADVMHAERVPADSDFFDDLGADSMLMAQFCARVRKRGDLPPVSMRDIYQHPTIRSLATALTDATPAPVESPVPAPIEMVTPASTRQYVLCGTLQLLFFLGYCFVAVFIFLRGYGWVSATSGLIDFYLRSVLFGSAIFLAAGVLPILVKWMLIGRWKPQQIRIWSLAYLRFWIVKTLVRSNPLAILAVGSPLYALYLRALGAKVGRGVAIFSPNVPVCTDLLTIGDGTVIRKDSFISCYRAHAGLIQTGAVTLGNDVFIGERTVLDINTSMGDGAQLGHTSSLQAGQAVPGGERWHGSPAQRTEVDYRAVDPARCGTLRRACYPVRQLLTVLLLWMPLAVGGVDILLTKAPQLTSLGSGSLAFTSWTLYRDALAVSLVLFFGLALVGLLVEVTVPRILNLAIKPDKVYPLYGFHYSVHRATARLTNIKFFKTIFGDSSYIVPYLRGLGYDLSPPVVQTGSNFAMESKHETPFLVSVGSGTVIAGGLSVINAIYSSTSFRVSRASIGSHNFLGNDIAYPPQGRTGDNCLLATKVMVPLDGEVREGVGLLGSPCFEIPRTVERDNKFIHLAKGDDLPRRLAAKNRHNVVTMGLFLLSHWFYVFVLTVAGFGIEDLYHSSGASVVAAIALADVVIFVFSILYPVLVERAATGFRALRPMYCSIYQIDFWRRERFLKLTVTTLPVLNGTPFKNVIWRLLGVRLGRRVFDDGFGMSEKNMVTIGDDVTLNAGSYVQCHSQEDYAFKSDRSTVGAGCTLGVGALVHYGVTMGDGAVLAADSFLMKGEQIPSHESWGGNPARPMPDTSMASLQVGRDRSNNRTAALTTGK
jgi:non-ribosomal peptide synthetase-like protein